MAELHSTPRETNGQEVPLRKENYTTYLYIGFAVIVAVLTVVGFSII